MGVPVETVGFVLRYSDRLLAKNIDTIAEHNKVLNKEGMVFIGKIGKFIGKNTINICNNETIDKVLLLVKKEKNGYVFHAAKISSAQTVHPALKLIPEYYRESPSILSWIAIKEPLRRLSEKQVSSWVLKSSRLPIRESLASSMASYFIVVRA